MPLFARDRGRRLAATGIFLASGLIAEARFDDSLYLASPSLPPPTELGRHSVSVTETRQIVPGPGLVGIDVQTANNNLDVVRHTDGRVYLAFRTAPTHFASKDAVIQVVSSDDERTWRAETRLSIGADIREPRFLSWGDKLFLYVARLGSDALAFEPQGVSLTELGPNGWSSLESVDDLGSGTIAWRTRVVNDRPLMVAYRGGEHLYRFDGLPMSVELHTSTDGRHWTPLDATHPTSYAGGGSEADFAIGDDGHLMAVVRNEAGDDRGAGSALCEAPAGDWAHWSCNSDPKKYDSPLMFWHDGEAYMVGRRHLGEAGAYDRHLAWRNPTLRVIYNELRYIWEGKRCSIWRFVGGEKRAAYVADLPSRGDTCFASVLSGDRPDELVIYDYSSDIHGPDVVWNVGQRGPTFIYRHVVHFAPRSFDDNARADRH